MLTLTNVSKEFTKIDKNKKETAFLADDDISFSIHDGEIFGLLGPNGAGKTTLLRIIAGIMKPTSGFVTVGGRKYDENDIEIKKEIAFLSGNTNLYGDISCVELLMMCSQYYGIEKKTAEKRINEIVDRFELNEFKNQRIGKLSTGQTQRVGIARCVLHNPHYYIFDEATSGLDVISGQIILDFIKEEKAKGKCILYSTHYMEEAENICDKVYLINNGRKVAEGTPSEIVHNTNTTNLRDAFFFIIKGAEK